MDRRLNRSIWKEYRFQRKWRIRSRIFYHFVFKKADKDDGLLCSNCKFEESFSAPPFRCTYMDTAILCKQFLCLHYRYRSEQHDNAILQWNEEITLQGSATIWCQRPRSFRRFKGKLVARSFRNYRTFGFVHVTRTNSFSTFFSC